MEDQIKELENQIEEWKKKYNELKNDFHKLIIKLEKKRIQNKEGQREFYRRNKDKMIEWQKNNYQKTKIDRKIKRLEKLGRLEEALKLKETKTFDN